MNFDPVRVVVKKLGIALRKLAVNPNIFVHSQKDRSGGLIGQSNLSFKG